jgi:hypothetical protein
VKSSLKTATVRIEALGRDLEIRELSHKVTRLISEDEGGRSAVIICKHCVPEFADETLDDLEENLSFRATQEIATEVYKLSGADLSKNSERATTDDSSSDLE